MPSEIQNNELPRRHRAHQFPPLVPEIHNAHGGVSALHPLGKRSQVGKDAYRSFPSGHTCAAGTTYALLALPHLFKKYNTVKYKVLFYFVSVIFTGTVAISRIVCGAHFFSDVLVGGTSMFLGVMLAIKIFVRKDYERV